MPIDDRGHTSQSKARGHTSLLEFNSGVGGMPQHKALGWGECPLFDNNMLEEEY
ncbi:MAG: hypothetical protein HPY66_1203 [Firmicutes bacterium]|nr:hypothetical protein [Bacillota bacterium]